LGWYGKSCPVSMVVRSSRTDWVNTISQGVAGKPARVCGTAQRLVRGGELHLECRRVCRLEKEFGLDG